VTQRSSNAMKKGDEGAQPWKVSVGGRKEGTEGTAIKRSIPEPTKGRGGYVKGEAATWTLG